MKTENNTALILRATAFAALKHSNQRRKDSAASPYINHPIALATLLANEGGIDNATVICAALLHDTVEDTETTFAELEEHFGAAVSGIVAEVTDDKSLEKPKRKLLQIEHAANSSFEAKLVKLADKICNLRDVLASPPTHWPLARQQEYFEWSAKVVAGLKGTNERLEQIFSELYAQKHTLGK